MLVIGGIGHHGGDDLSICMGIPAEFDAPEFRLAVERILTVCRNAGKLCMTFTTDPSDARRYIEMGFDAVANNIDFDMIGRAYKDMIRQIRDPQ